METKTKIKNLPEEIYLQVGELTEDEVDFSKLSEVTWSGEKVFPNDVEYRLVHENKSVIKWQTGEPKEYGRYLVSLKNGTVESSHACRKIEGGFDFVPGGRNVIAWCKLSDIEPYKEEQS